MGIYLRFYEENIIVFKDKGAPSKPYFKDKDSILNALNLIRDVFNTHEKFYHEIDESESTSANLVNYKVGEYFHLCIGNTVHTFYIKKTPYYFPEVSLSFGLSILETVINSILS
jgi:hypothetical protein